VAYRLAEENLRIGRTVVADSVNPLNITRDAWLSVAADASKDAIEIEVICSDPSEHRRRVETRNADIDGLSLWRPPEGAASGIFRHGFYFQ
jgi:predicted kinase